MKNRAFCTAGKMIRCVRREPPQPVIPNTCKIRTTGNCVLPKVCSGAYSFRIRLIQNDRARGKGERRFMEGVWNTGNSRQEARDDTGRWELGISGKLLCFCGLLGHVLPQKSAGSFRPAVLGHIFSVKMRLSCF